MWDFFQLYLCNGNQKGNYSRCESSSEDFLLLVTSFAYELLVVNLATISDSPLGALSTQPKPRSLDNIPQAVTHLPVRGLSSAPIQCSQSGENAGYLWEWLTDLHRMCLCY